LAKKEICATNKTLKSIIMKKLSFLFLSFLTSINLYAQDIVFTFNAQDASNTIDSIRATKVETGETVLVEGSNTINMSSFATGNKLFPTNVEEISVYPNPFENYTQLIFHSNQNNNVKVSLINPAGQVVAEKNQNITSGIHQFNISTKNNGLYVLNVDGSKNRFSKKIISTRNNQSLNVIEYKGFSSMSSKEKSAQTEYGKLIFFFVYSGDNITKIADSPSESKTYEVEFYECKDTDGKSYPIVQIGDQWWMAENLAYLPIVNNPRSESTTVSMFYVNGYWGQNINEAKAHESCQDYGVLYNWPAAMESCPQGWHLPTKNEWEQLAQFVNDQKGPFDFIIRQNEYKEWEELGKYLKASSGWDEEANGTDDFGFTGYIGGQRDTSGFNMLSNVACWWTSTEIENYYTDMVYNSLITVDHQLLTHWNYTVKLLGFNVRCVKD
jgi:uncharacterized protein (TIGR02145 family)